MTYNFLINGQICEEPIGWDGFEYMLQRSDEYIGLENVFSIDVLEFDGVGATLIRADFETNGFDGTLDFTIQILCDGVVTDQIDAVINQSTYKEINGNVSVHIEESGFHRKFKNRLDIPVNFNDTESIGGVDIGLPEIFDLGLHGKEINKSSLFKFADPDEAPYTDEVPPGWTFAAIDTDNPVILYDSSEGHRTLEQSFSQDVLPETEIYNEIEEHGTDITSLVRINLYPADDVQAQSSFLFQATNSLPEIYRIEGKFRFGTYTTAQLIEVTESNKTEFTFSQSLTPKLYVKIGSTTTLVETKPIVTYDAIIPIDIVELHLVTVFPFVSYEFEFNTSGTVEEFETIQVFLKIDSIRYIERPEFNILIPPASFNIDIIMYTFFNKEYESNIDSYISTIEQSKEGPTSCKAILIFDAFKRVCESTTDTLDCFRSDFFGVGCGKWTAVTNGKNLRQMRQKDAVTYFPIVTNFKDLFGSANAIWNLGMRIEIENGIQYIRVEEKSYFYDGNAILTLENVAGIETNVATELLYNEAEFGYDKWNLNIGRTNGIDEFNSVHRYSLPVVNIKKKYSAKSKFITSGYAIEETRRMQYKDNPSADFETDDDNFFICTNTELIESALYTIPAVSTTYAAGTVSERKENFATVANVLSPDTCYNLRLSPLRMALNYYPLLAASMDKKVNPIIKFISGEGNFEEIDEMDDGCDKAVGSITQNQNILAADVLENRAYYRPYYLIFDYPLIFQQFLNIRNNSIMAIAFTCGNETLLGYIKEIKFEPNGENGGIASFKLLEALCRLGAFDESFDESFDIGTC